MKKLFVLFAVLGIFGSAPGVQGDQGFDNETLAGTFAFSTHGVLGLETASIPAGTPSVTTSQPKRSLTGNRPVGFIIPDLIRGVGDFHQPHPFSS